MTERNKQIILWLRRLYCPRGYAPMISVLVSNLDNTIHGTAYRAITPEDKGKIIQDCLIIRTKGVGNRKSFAGAEKCRIDVNNVSKFFAEIAIVHEGQKVEIRRINYKTNLEINIPC